MTSETVSLSFSDGNWSAMLTSAGLAVLFNGREIAGVGSGSDMKLTLREVEPGERWSASWDGADAGLEVDATAMSAPVRSEQLVTVTGTVRAGGESSPVRASGQLSRTPVLDWSSLALVRYVSAWLAEGEGIVLESQRPARAKGHGDESVWAALVERGEEVPIFDPRLSTTYDGDGHQRRAGLELWTSEEDGYPVRAAGEVICGSSLDLGGLTLDLAFFRWHAGGGTGIGRYDILRKRS